MQIFFFLSVQISREVLTNCGIKFLSKLLQQVYQFLGIKGIKTTLYHTQLYELVEGFNWTLKNIMGTLGSD